VRAQERYAQADYAGALAAYDSVATTHRSAALLFNIGNCHMKLDDVPHAVLFYERAIRLEPGAEDIRANLDHARQQVVDRIHELPAFTLGSFWDRLRGGKDEDQWARRALWSCLALFAGATAFLFVRQGLVRRLLLGGTALALICTVVATALGAYRVKEVNDRSEAIIMLPKVDVLGEPRQGATTVFVLHEGTKISVLSDQNGWYEVKLASGSVGWAPPGSLERI
ncbi:MAG TPA: tetratricopeptide repeat protein, partial [Flavobacteriales bacterium]|nr:tetratricopeptide repeat protein [Flavobacteriales bacterium]